MGKKDLDKWYRVEHVEYEEKPPEPPKQTFKIPPWIPYPVSWLRAIVLSFMVGIVAYTGRFFGFYGALLGLMSGKLALLIALCSLGLIIPFVLMAYVHCWLLGKKPKNWSKNLPAPNSIREAATAFAAMIISVLITVIIYIPFPDELFKDLVFTEGQFLVSIWFMISVYLFQIDFLVRRRRNSKKQKERIILQRK